MVLLTLPPATAAFAVPATDAKATKVAASLRSVDMAGIVPTEKGDLRNNERDGKSLDRASVARSYMDSLHGRQPRFAAAGPAQCCIGMVYWKVAALYGPIGSGHVKKGLVLTSSHGYIGDQKRHKASMEW